MIWTHKELQDIFKNIGPQVSDIKSVVIDSRLVQDHSLFIALSGNNYDGHNFVRNAFLGGAGAAIVARAIPEFEEQLIIVRDPYAALCQLAEAARARCHGKIIAVTGSVGKTTTKHILHSLLSAQAVTVSSAKSYNNYTGVPVSLAHLHQDTVYGVFEMGMNHANEITPLSKLVRPHVGLITTIAPAHIENLGSLERIAQAKAEIFAGIEPNGIAILPRDVDQYELLVSEAKRYGVSQIITFGHHEAADVRCLEYTSDAEGSSVEVRLFDVPLRYHLSLPGAHHISNSLAALAAVYAVGGDIAQAVTGLSTLAPVEGRGLYHRRPWKDGEIILVDETYNANPASVAAALKALMLTPTQGRRIAILGDMRELGEYALEFHQNLAPTLHDSNIDLVCTCGVHMAELNKALPPSMRGPHVATSEQMVEKVNMIIQPGDTVMIKGSRGMRMETILHELLKGTPEC